MLFVNNKSIKALKISNQEIKKEMENLRAKYKIDTEETKLQITDEIQKYTCLSPSDSVQEEIKN